MRSKNPFDRFRIEILLLALLTISTTGMAQLPGRDLASAEQEVFFTSINKTKKGCVFVTAHRKLRDDSNKSETIFVHSCPSQTQIIRTEWIGPFQDVEFYSPDGGWAIVGGSLVKIDGNSVVSSDLHGLKNKDFNDLFSADGRNIWVVGVNGSIFHSSDGGKNWALQHSKSDADFQSVYFVNDLKGWIIGSKRDYDRNIDSFALLQTVDGGANWKSFSQPEDKSIIKLFFTDESNGWGIQYGKGIAKITDSSTAWRFDLNDTVELNDIYFADPLTGWAVSDKEVLASSNGGKSWERRFNPSLDSEDSLTNVVFVSSTNGWIISDRQLFYTQDAGINWKRVEFSY